MEGGSYMPQLGVFSIAGAALPFYTDFRLRRSLRLHSRLPEYNATYLYTKKRRKTLYFPLNKHSNAFGIRQYS